MPITWVPRVLQDDPDIPVSMALFMSDILSHDVGDSKEHSNYTDQKIFHLPTVFVSTISSIFKE
jgi:hypothetical protein